MSIVRDGFEGSREIYRSHDERETDGVVPGEFFLSTH